MPAAKKAVAVKPTYKVMVTESIKELGDRTGSSVQAISKQLRSKYNIDINKPALIKAIKKGVEAGDLVQIKASYKLAKKGPTVTKKKATAVVVKPKPTVKAPATATTTVKKKTTTAAAKKALKPKKSLSKTRNARSVSTSVTTVKKRMTKRSVAARKDATKMAALSKKRTVKK